MILVEYKLHKAGKNALKAPDFIEDGGYWKSPIDNTMVGWVKPENEREYYIPDTLLVLTKDEFIVRQQLIHETVPVTMENPETGETITLTNMEVVEQASLWYDSFAE